MMNYKQAFILIGCVAVTGFIVGMWRSQKRPPAPPPYLLPPPPLYVEGHMLKRSDTHTPVVLKGVTTMAFVSYRYTEKELLDVLERVKSWNINTLGLFINPDTLQGQEDLLDRVIDWAEEKRIYVYLMPAIQIRNIQKSEAQQVKMFPSLIDTLASRYAHRSHILFGLWAEPRSIIWPQWEVLARDMEQRITRVNPQAVILFTGVQFGRFFDVSRPALTSRNILYDFHDYPAADEDELQPLLEHRADFLWTSLVGSSPVFVGEFGGVYKEDFGSIGDLMYIQQVLDEVNRHGLHYTAYTIDEEGELGLIDWKTGKPTAKGKYIQKDLALHPPTQF